MGRARRAAEADTVGSRRPRRGATGEAIGSRWQSSNPSLGPGPRAAAAAIRARTANPMRRAIYRVVARIPYGRVATYGQVATLAGYPGRARQVGYALAGMPEGLDLPWHRVINAQGKVSPRLHSLWHEFQYELLEREGIAFRDNRVDLAHYGWQPSPRRSRAG
ncbi:MAG: MGMT family protein [Candidatus Latescibacterota bacterium]